MAKDCAISAVLSRAPFGLAAPLVRVEVHLGNGLPTFAVVGLPEAAVRESRERVRAAIANSGFPFPAGRIIVNLAPADLPKEGSRFDLPIAIGILAAAGFVPAAALNAREFYGELSLSGELRETPKLLPALIAGMRAGHELIVPSANRAEAQMLGSHAPKLAAELRQVRLYLNRLAELAVAPAASADAGSAADYPDLADVRGQFAGKRALEIAASGAHGLLMIGPPGAGKTLLAQRLPGLLPPLEPAQAMEVASIMSAAGLRPGGGMMPPFRRPQHTASAASLVGGGASMRPGELSLAHRGVLFLDELPEFSRDALEALREPMESGIVVLSRAKGTLEYPAEFQLVAAMNPCPCGYLGDERRSCRCTGEQVSRYRGKISGPLLDRIDIHLELQSLAPEHLVHGEDADRESSASVAVRVAAARARQWARQGKLNARLCGRELAAVAALEPAARRLLSEAISRLALSARAYERVLKLARSCADLAGESAVAVPHLCEAIALRALDRTAGRAAPAYLFNATI